MKSNHLFWGCIPLVVLMSFVSTLYRSAQVPSRAEWQDAVQWIEKQWQAGDQVTWYPSWVSEGKIYLHNLSVIHPVYQGDFDLGHAKRLWVLSSMGEDASDWLAGHGVKSIHVLQKVKLIKKKQLDSVEISLWHVEQGQSYASLYQQWDNAQQVQVKRTRHTRRGSQSTQNCALWALGGWHCLARKQQTKVDRCIQRPLQQKLQLKSRRRDLYTLDHRRFLPYVDCGLDARRHVTRDARVIDQEARHCIAMTPMLKDDILIHWRPILNRSNSVSNTSVQAQSKQSKPSGKKQEKVDRMEIWLAYGWEDLTVNHPFRESRTKSAQLQVAIADKTWDFQAKPIVQWQRQVLHPTHQALTHIEQQGIQLKVSTQHKGDRDSVLCVQLSVRQSY